jgi:predicted amidophosphoribosyltransferase
VCPKCGGKVDHQRGIPCQEERCPRCGAKLLREGSHHHRLFQEKQAKKRQKNSDTAENKSS